jgi:hypothetical protein
MNASRFERGKAYQGMATRAVENGWLRLEYLAETGPRIVRLLVTGSQQNLLAEVPGFSWETPHGTYAPLGGHRLWRAPESQSLTSLPEGRDLVIEEDPATTRLLQPADPYTGIAKSMEIKLLRDSPVVRVIHSLRNEGASPVDLAPWAITMLPPGGAVFLPLRAETADPDGLWPNRFLALWPYSEWNDPRFYFGPDALRLEATSDRGPAKLGTFIHAGWIGYLRRGVLFCKRFTPLPDRPHPDLGCNVEVYLHRDFVELETLGPLVLLKSGETVTHLETWEIYRDPSSPTTPAEIREVIDTAPSPRHPAS